MSTDETWSTYIRYNNMCHVIFYFKIVWPYIVTNSLWIKPTDALDSNFVGITNLHVSGSLSAHHQEFLAVHRHWYILCRFEDRLLPVLMEFHPAPGNKRPQKLAENGHQNCIKCTRVGTLIVATTYLQLIQNRYMFRSFTVLQCSHQHCVQPIASDVEVVGYL